MAGRCCIALPPLPPGLESFLMENILALSQKLTIIVLLSRCQSAARKMNGIPGFAAWQMPTNNKSNIVPSVSWAGFTFEMFRNSLQLNMLKATLFVNNLKISAMKKSSNWWMLSINRTWQVNHKTITDRYYYVHKLHNHIIPIIT